jgi:nucleotide-binding universal stress UspA family protein
MTGPSTFSLANILVPTDLSPASDALLAHVGCLAAHFDAKVTLFHALEVPDHRFAHWAFAHEHEVWKEAERQARDAVGRHARALGLRVDTRVERSSRPADAIVEAARQTDAQLVAMATHGREGIAHFLLGSVTERVIERARRPVLAYRPGEAIPSFPYRRILLATDFSLMSRLVFPLAGQLARTLSADLVCVHVYPAAPLARLAGLPEPDPVEVPTEEAVVRFVEADLGGLPVRVQIHRGTVWERIVHAARTEAVDLIVMSTRGHHSLADDFLGSNTERVLRHAPCPVLVA